MQDTEALRQRLREFASARNWQQFHTPKNLSMALSVEASELMEIFQWLTPEQSRELSPDKLQHLREEIGDVMIYLAALGDAYGIDPVQAAHEKVAINEQKYPANLARGKALKSSELKEQ